MDITTQNDEYNNFKNNYIYEINEKKNDIKNISKNLDNIIKNIEYKFKSNNFDPQKYSPNLFLKKLEFRIKNYCLEEELNNDILIL
jgi:hypothetical protein